MFPPKTQKHTPFPIMSVLACRNGSRHIWTCMIPLSSSLPGQLEAPADSTRRPRNSPNPKPCSKKLLNQNPKQSKPPGPSRHRCDVQQTRRGPTRGSLFFSWGRVLLMGILLCKIYAWGSLKSSIGFYNRVPFVGFLLFGTSHMPEILLTKMARLEEALQLLLKVFLFCLAAATCTEYYYYYYYCYYYCYYCYYYYCYYCYYYYHLTKLQNVECLVQRLVPRVWHLTTGVPCPTIWQVGARQITGSRVFCCLKHDWRLSNDGTAHAP